jgi:hypothetical protein
METNMQRLTMLVTPDAQWVLPESPEFFEALDDPKPDYDAIAYAVKNLGFIKFQVLGGSIVEVELHPQNVELPALLAIQQEIIRSEVNLFRIKFFDTAWRSEISSSREQVVARLSEICAPIFAPVPTERFHVEVQDLSKVFDDEDNWMRPLAMKWRVAFGNFEHDVIPLAYTHGLLSRLVIAGVRPSQEPVWRFIGDGHKWIGKDYQHRGIGERMENMPDKEYGKWVSGFYKTVAASGQPRYDHVTGTIQWEDERGRPRRLYRYERLMLPWKTPSGEVLVTLCSRPLANPVDSMSTSSMTPPLFMNSAMSA